MNEQCSGGLHTDCLGLGRQSVLQHFSGMLDGDVALNYLAGMDAADHWAFDHQDAALSQASGVAHTLARIGAVIQAHVGVLDQVPEALVRVLAISRPVAPSMWRATLRSATRGCCQPCGLRMKILKMIRCFSRS